MYSDLIQQKLQSDRISSCFLNDIFLSNDRKGTRISDKINSEAIKYDTTTKTHKLERQCGLLPANITEQFFFRSTLHYVEHYQTFVLLFGADYKT